MGIFDKKEKLSKGEIKKEFIKDSGVIPGTGGKKYYSRDRERIAMDLFKGKYSPQISKRDFKQVVRKIGEQGLKEKSGLERKALKERASYLKRIGGIK